jgi:hypothetical protein
MALCGNESERAHIPPNKKEICGTSYHSPVVRYMVLRVHDKQRTRHNIDRPFLQILDIYDSKVDTIWWS